MVSAVFVAALLVGAVVAAALVEAAVGSAIESWESGNQAQEENDGSEN